MIPDYFITIKINQGVSKKSFVLRINPDTLKLLDKWAADEFRSLNGQIEFLLQKALIDARRWKEPEPPVEKEKDTDPKS